MSLESPAAAERAFYTAFEQGSVDAMMAVWADRPDITCVHPLGSMLIGRQAVRESWLQIFLDASPRLFEIETVSTLYSPETAVHTVYETITIPPNGPRFPPIIATNAYRRIAGRWYMVLHHASPFAAPEDDAGSPMIRH